MKKLTLKEQHKLILEIAIEFDRICTKHSIPYYMLGGTMLGAVRHLGFIPWDDDMDFGVPRPFYNKLIEILTKELSDPYKCYTYSTHKGCLSPFFKICNTNTLIEDPRINVPLELQMGLNIDIFPLDYCTEKDKVYKDVQKRMLLFQTIYINNQSGSFIKNGIKRILRLLWPVSSTTYLNSVNNLLQNLPKSNYLSNVFGRWKAKEVIPIEWYGDCTRYFFEDVSFCGIDQAEKYLSKLYGDYMKLPPEDKRTPHAENVFLK